uniref:Protein SMG7 n=1 Tax=Phallusia mammillata TaxID=59560 RepID=A0A6F9DTU5_9ASCI|nr:protein SMG7 [Phallusia mammillata]
MNNCSQLLEQAENLKKELTNGRNGLSSDGSGTGEWVTSRTSLQDVYRQLLITNLEYALDKKIEQDLWNFVFKNHITALQQQVKDKSNNFRVEAQSQLTSFLDAASGFYAHLLDDLCSTFQINIPCRVKASKLVFLKDSSSIKKSSITQPERPSCQYMCQHCLVHLGDIARYRNQNGQAESYYRHAAQLVPSNGQPYNQLAILAAASGDVLSTAFYYCRSLAVKYPFPGSDTNLRRQLSKIMAGDEPRHTKISTSELVKFCLKFHACIYLKKHEDELNGMVERLAAYIRAHLRAGSLSRQQTTHMAFLNLFSLHYLAPNGVKDDGYPMQSGDAKEDEGKEHERLETEGNLPWQVMLTFTMHMLGGLLACVPAHSDDASDLEHPALPAVKIILDWLASNPAVLNCKEITLSSRVWPRLAKVLNALGNQDKANNSDNKPLPEDLELRGFVGLKQPLSKLDFAAGTESSIPDDSEHSCRCYRLYRLGLEISTINSELLSVTEETSGTVFSSSVAPSPQHGMKVNGVEEQSQLEEEKESEEEEQPLDEELELSTSPPRAGSRTLKEVRLVEPSSSSRRGGARGRASIKQHEDHQAANRKKNRAPRMQHVAVQIKPDNKLKVIKEEEGGYVDNYSHIELESESGGLSNESSQGDGSSPIASTQPRSGHRVTFAAPPQMSPTRHLSEEPQSPGPVVSGYLEQMGVMIPNVPMYADPNSRLLQQTYNRNMQHLGPIYHQTPAPPGNPILTAPFAPRNVAPFAYSHPQNIINRSHMIPQLQAMPQQSLHAQGSTPPHPTELPKPMFTGSRYSHLLPSEGFHPSQLSGSPSDRSGNLEHIPIQRPNDIGYILSQNPTSMPSMSPVSQDQSPTQRPLGPNMFLPNRFSGRSMPSMQMPPDLDALNELRFATSASSNRNTDVHRQRMDFLQMRPPNSNPLEPNPQEINLNAFDLTSDKARNFFHPFMNPAPGNLQGGGSNNTSSTSSPTPGSIGNQMSNMPPQTITPQTGSINYPGITSVLGQGFSSILSETSSANHDIPRRPNTLSGQQRSQPPGFVGSPSQKLTPTGLPPFYAESPSKQVENIFTRDGNRNASMFGISPSAGTKLTEDPRPFSKVSVSQSSSSEFPYSINQDRVKTLFDDASAKETVETQNQQMSKLGSANFESLLSKSAQLPNPDKFHAPPGLLPSEENKDSYQLFPDTGNTWGISRGNNRGDGLGLSGLGIIGSERAAAAQQSQQYSPWGALPTSTAPSSVPTMQESARGDPQLMQRGRAQELTPTSNDGGLTSQSFWSTQMMPSGPSTLEQLINHQQQRQHLIGRDHTPP